MCPRFHRSRLVGAFGRRDTAPVPLGLVARLVGAFAAVLPAQRVPLGLVARLVGAFGNLVPRHVPLAWLFVLVVRPVRKRQVSISRQAESLPADAAMTDCAKGA